jgi:Family of unknown function (DUF6077)
MRTVPRRSRTVGERLTWLVHVPGACEAALDLAVVVLATWTVVYHFCLVSGVGATPGAVLEAVTLALAAYLRWRAASRAHAAPPAGGGAAPQRVEPLARNGGAPLAAIAAACAILTALLVATNISWPTIAALWLAAAVAGTMWAVCRLPAKFDAGYPSLSLGAAPSVETARSALVALGWASVLSVLSVFTVRPDPDDVHYANWSQWVVDHGTFPLRDTIFSDLSFPMAPWPPLASYDTGIGVLASSVGVQAGTVLYLLVPPVATFLSVLAMWRLLTAWRVKRAAVALSVGLLFLLFDGGSGYAAPGNLFLTRLWQGKVVFLCVLVPTLLVYAVRYAELPTRRRAAWLFAGGVAGVGLTTTALFLVPLIALGGAAPLVRHSRRAALVAFAALASYPLGCLATTVLLGGRSGDEFGSRELYRFDPSWFGHAIFRDGPLAFVAVAAVLGGAFLVPHPAARLTTAVLALVTGVTLVPGVTHLSYDLVGLGPTLWRVSWTASTAVLVGVLAAQVLPLGPRPLHRFIGPFALVATLVIFGLPIWSARNGTVLASPQWKRSATSLTDARIALRAVHPGDLVLAPPPVAVTIAVLTTRVKTVAPRAYLLDYLRDDTRFHYAQRLTLFEFADGLLPRSDRFLVARALRALRVDEVCLPVDVPWGGQLLVAQGYRLTAASPTSDFYTRRAPQESIRIR